MSITISNIQKTSIDVNWSNVTSDYDYVSVFLNNKLVQHLPYGTTSQTIDDLTPGYNYTVRITNYKVDGWDYCGCYHDTVGEDTITTIDVTPPSSFSQSGLTANEITFTWVNNDATSIFNSKYLLQKKLYTSLPDSDNDAWYWVDRVEIATTSTQYSISAPPLSSEKYRLAWLVQGDPNKTGGRYVYSNLTTGTTDASLVDNLTVNDSDTTSIDIMWENVVTGTSIIVQVDFGSGWVTVATLSPTDTTYTITGLDPWNSYPIRIGTFYGGVWNYSNTVIGKTKPTESQFLPQICQCTSSISTSQSAKCVWGDIYDDFFTVTPSTCGLDNGIIEINDINYFDFFDFIVVGWDESIQSFNYYINPTGSTATQCTGLTSGYYELQITTKDDYVYYYGDGCSIQYIPITNTGSTFSSGAIIRKPVICGPFDNQQGRIIWNFNDTEGGSSGYTYNVFARTINPDKLWYNLPNSLWRSDWTDKEFAFTNSDRGDRQFYVLIESNYNGCKILFGPNTSGEIAGGSSISGIKRLFITPYSGDLDWNYWKTSDEDYFLEGVDESNFFSTKIKEYYSLSGGSLTWYNIPVKGTMSITQSLSKVRQGLILKDTLNVDVPKGMIERFDQFTTLLPNKWVYVLEDSMGQWWTGGYQVGSTIETYKQQTGARGEENKYSFNIVAESSDKILTAIDTAYALGAITNEAGAPQNLIATDESPNSVTVEWDAVYYSDYLTAQIYTGGTWGSIATLNGNVTSYTFLNLDSETTYQFRVLNTFDGDVFISDSVSGTTVISYPQTITIGTETETTIPITWAAVSQYSDALIPQIYTGGTWNDVTTLSSGSTAYTYTGLTSNTSYPVRVSNYYNGKKIPSAASTGTTEPGLLDNLYSYSMASNYLGADYGVQLFFGSNYSEVGSGGKIDKYIQVNGASDVTGGHSNSTGWSIGFWFKYDNTGSDETILGFPNSNRLYKDSSDNVHFERFGFGNVISFSPMFSGGWYYIMLTFDGTTVTAYLDNSSQGSSSFPLNPSSLYLGYRSDSSLYLTGGFCEFGLWDRVLSSSNRSALYNSGSGYRPA